LSRAIGGDAGYVVVAMTILLAAAMTASLLPAGRAARISPSDAIRAD
jgi:ABC-type lipoprotein release transport system permease subunit